jgi:hypothetical protein
VDSRRASRWHSPLRRGLARTQNRLTGREVTYRLGRTASQADDQLPHAPDVTATSTVEADGSLVTTSRAAPAADVALPPVTLAQ